MNLERAFPLSRRGKPLAPITVSRGASEPERYAADELRRHLTQITGAPFEVRGYADTRLRNPMDPFHYSNRRVSLLIPYMSEPDTKAPAP